MFVSANIDLAAYRTDLNSPTPERDLSTFIDQVQRVSLQVSEVKMIHAMNFHMIIVIRFKMLLHHPD